MLRGIKLNRNKIMTNPFTNINNLFAPPRQRNPFNQATQLPTGPAPVLPEVQSVVPFIPQVPMGGSRSPLDNLFAGIGMPAQEQFGASLQAPAPQVPQVQTPQRRQQQPQQQPKAPEHILQTLLREFSRDGGGQAQNPVDREKERQELWELKFPGSAERYAQVRAADEARRSMNTQERLDAAMGLGQGATREQRAEALRGATVGRRLQTGAPVSFDNAQGGKDIVSKYGTGSSRQASQEEMDHMRATIPDNVKHLSPTAQLMHGESMNGSARLGGQVMPIKDALAQGAADIPGWTGVRIEEPKQPSPTASLMATAGPNATQDLNSVQQPTFPQGPNSLQGPYPEQTVNPALGPYPNPPQENSINRLFAEYGVFPPISLGAESQPIAPPQRLGITLDRSLPLEPVSGSTVKTQPRDTNQGRRTPSGRLIPDR
jgi:hypothetical protein